MIASVIFGAAPRPLQATPSRKIGIMYLKKLILILLLGGVAFYSSGQDHFGALNSNYSPTNSVHINPTSMLDAKTWLDLHIVGAGAYVNNTLAAVESTTIIGLIRQRDLAEDDLIYRQDKAPYHGYNHNFVSVLSAVWSQGNHAAGLSFNAYSYTDARRIDEPIGRFIENGVSQYTDQHLTDYSIQRLRANALGYAEAKLSYAYTFLKQDRNMFMGGLSYKKIFPLAGGAANIRDFAYNVFNDTVFYTYDLTGDAMANIQPEFNLRGGWGFDLGFTWQRMYSNCSSYYPNSKRGGCNPLHYKYKLGVSITDLGYAKFNPDNTSYVGYNLEDVTVFNYPDLTAEAGTFPTVFVGDEDTPNEGVVRDPNRMSLPTAISVQFDRNIKPHFFYLNATWVHGIPPTKGAFGPRRAHTLSVTPRIETKWFDAALPLSLYEYQRVQLGLSLRFYCLTIGTDKLLNYFIRSDIYGGDFYFHLKVPLFRNPKCKGRGNGFGGKKGNKGGWAGRKHPKCAAYQ